MANHFGAALAAIFLAGCTGTYTPNDPDRIPEGEGDGEMSAAERLFADQVVPILGAKCAACHTSAAAGDHPKFLGDSESAYYDQILQYPSVTGNFDAGLAGLFSKIAAGHYGVTYTAAERESLIGWLAAEALARGDGDDDGDIDQLPAVNALAEWAGCMSLDDWVASGMARWGDKESEKDGPCLTCHDDGLARFFAGPDATEMFSMQRFELYIIGFFTVRVRPDGTQEVVPALGKLRRMGTGNFHPRFQTDLDGDAEFAGLEQFHQLTMTRKTGGDCGPAGFPAAPEM
jgi:mono/diheme cytochrome c family protein